MGLSFFARLSLSEFQMTNWCLSCVRMASIFAVWAFRRRCTPSGSSLTTSYPFGVLTVKRLAFLSVEMISSVPLFDLWGCSIAIVFIWGMMLSISMLDEALVSLYDLDFGLGL